MAILKLREGDTLPVLRVRLNRPDGTVFDDAVDLAELYILGAEVPLVRTMTSEGAGIYRYAWLATDWDAPSGGDPATVGGLASDSWRHRQESKDHRMEYVVTISGDKLTFPTEAPDTLRIRRRIA